MTLAELLIAYEARKREAEVIGATAPVARVYERVLKDLREVDGVPEMEQRVSTTVAGELEGVHASTIAKRCADGWYPGADKTSEHGEWRIPLSDLRRPRRPHHRGPFTPSLIR